MKKIKDKIGNTEIVNNNNNNNKRFLFPKMVNNKKWTVNRKLQNRGFVVVSLSPKDGDVGVTHLRSPRAAGASLG